MNFLLVALILNISTGEPMGLERIQTYADPQACLTAMNEGRIERAADGLVRSYICLREDQLGERST